MVYHVMPLCTIVMSCLNLNNTLQNLLVNSNLCVPATCTMVDPCSFTMVDHDGPSFSQAVLLWWTTLSLVPFKHLIHSRPWSDLGQPWFTMAAPMNNHVHNMVDHGQSVVLVLGNGCLFFYCLLFIVY